MIIKSDGVVEITDDIDEIRVSEIIQICLTLKCAWNNDTISDCLIQWENIFKKFSVEIFRVKCLFEGYEK